MYLVVIKILIITVIHNFLYNYNENLKVVGDEVIHRITAFIAGISKNYQESEIVFDQPLPGIWIAIDGMV